MTRIRQFRAVAITVVGCALSACAGEPAALSPQRAYLGANAAEPSAGTAGREQPALSRIEPTLSSKVLSAIVFERVTGRSAYPDATGFESDR